MYFVKFIKTHKSVMNNSFKELGAKLVEDARLNEEFSAQRGLINELFPYIYEASKRMSSRAISRWLEANGTKLSPATVAKALRNPDPYWQEIFDEIEPSVLIFERAHKVEAEEFLKNADVFHMLAAKPPTLHAQSDDGIGDAFDEYDSARAKIDEDWFTMPEQAIEACLSSVDFSNKKSADEQEKTQEESK